jgi:hypothetical protein
MLDSSPCGDCPDDSGVWPSSDQSVSAPTTMNGRNYGLRRGTMRSRSQSGRAMMRTTSGQSRGHQTYVSSPVHARSRAMRAACSIESRPFSVLTSVKMMRGGRTSSRSGLPGGLRITEDGRLQARQAKRDGSLARPPFLVSPVPLHQARCIWLGASDGELQPAPPVPSMPAVVTPNGAVLASARE